METRGFQFNAPAAARLENIQAPKFDFVSGESLVADPGIDIWLKGQQQASENLLSGITIGVKGLTEGISTRYEQENKKEILKAELEREDRLLKEKIEREEKDATTKFLRDIYLADYKSDDKTLKDNLTRLQIAEKQRELAAADFYTPLPELTPAPGTSMAGVAAPEKGFSAGTTGRFSMGLSDTPAPDQSLFADQAAPPATPQEAPNRSRYQDKDLGGGKSGVFDMQTGKLVPGTITDKSEGVDAAPTPEGYTKEGFTKKTKTGTETYKKEGAGKELTSEMVTKLSQFDSVKMSMGEIKQTMAGIDRGPITGFLREKNPYDVDAQYLNKLVESVVPGLARTVFGEVGVLTDADVKRYKEMVPNMKTEEQVAEALIKMLDKKIEASYDGYIKTAKKAGYNVSGFEAAAAEEKAATDTTAAHSGLLGEIKALREKVKTTGLVDTTRPALIQSIAAKTKEYIQKTGQSPKL